MKEIISNDSLAILTQALEEMKSSSDGRINLAELERRTGISRQRLRTLRKKNFLPVQRTRPNTVPHIMDGFESISSSLLEKGVVNSVVHLNKLREYGYTGSFSSVKRYITKHKNLVPAPRQLTRLAQSKGVRYQTEPGKAYQMDWGFTKTRSVWRSTSKTFDAFLICMPSMTACTTFFLKSSGYFLRIPALLVLPRRNR